MMPKIRQKERKSEKETISEPLISKSKSFEKHFFEEMTYLTPIKENDRILDKLRQTSSEKTVVSKIKHKILMLLLNILSVIRKNPSRKLSPKARKVLNQIKDLAILYELGCVDENEFIFYKMELGKNYYEILDFAKKVDFDHENEEYYVSKIKEMVKNLEK